MEATFTPVADAAELEQLFARSNDGAIILFKHSTTCPISAAAYREMGKLAGVEVSLVVVQKARDISRAVETRTGVRHESPQAFVLRGGQVVWSASHWDVTAEAVKDALQEAGKSEK